MKNSVVKLMLVVGAFSTTNVGARSLEVDGYFSNGMVLQAGKATVISGQAKPFAVVKAKINDEDWVSGTAGSDGRWGISLNSSRPNPNNTITISSVDGETKKLLDVRFGEVWLCAGQSNMEMDLIANNSIQQIDQTLSEKISSIRLRPQVGRKAVLVPEAERPWASISSKAYKHVSAACYHFAEERLRKHPGGYIGLVNVAIGSTSIQSWAPADATTEVGEKSSPMSGRDGAAVLGPFARAISAWRTKLEQSQATFATSSDGKALGARVQLLQWNFPVLQQAKGEVKISLPQFYGTDLVSLNGVAIGSESQPEATPRNYMVPAGLMVSGMNRLDIYIHVPFGLGGLESFDGIGVTDTKDESFHPKLSLVYSKWIPTDKDAPPVAAWDYRVLPHGAWNGMLAPIAGIAAEGLIWYQGEGNTRDERDEYKNLLSSVLKETRRAKPELKAAIIQLPPYIPSPPTKGGIGWSRIREAQRAVALADPKAVLVVLSDKEPTTELHQKDKVDVGRRVAAALEFLEKKTKPPGTNFTVALKSRNGILEAEFSDLGGELSFEKAGQYKSGDFFLCDEERKFCQPADVLSGAGRRLSLSLPKGVATPAVLYYCWGDSVSCSLRAGGFPLSPFSVRLN